MDVALAARYRLWMWLLLPLTVGVGTAVLWLRARRWPRRLDSSGILLRGGRFVRWSDIHRLGIVKRDYDETVRIDLHAGHGVTRIPIRHLTDGPQIAAMIRASFDGAKGRSGQAVR